MVPSFKGGERAYLTFSQNSDIYKASFLNTLSSRNNMSSLTYQYRLYPFGDQAETLEYWLGSCRRLYNAALEQRKVIREMGGKIGYPKQQKELTELRAAFPEYDAVPVHVLQNVLLRLDRAFENFFRLHLL